MRIASFVLLLTLFAAPIFAQEEHPKFPPTYTLEEWKQVMGLQQKINEAFSFNNYADGLNYLREQMPLLKTALERVEAGKAPGDLGDKVDMWKQICRVGYQQIPGIANNYYNQACCCSKVGKKDEALDALQSSIDNGYLDLDHMKMDSDLDPIRNDARYKQIIGSLTYNEVYASYVAPTAPEADAPLILVLHERGGNEEKAIETWKAVADRMKAVMVAPRAPITGPNKQFGWQKTTSDDEEGLKKILFTLDAALAKFPVSASKVYIVGDRQGGKFATLFGLMHADKVAGVVPVNGYWNKYYYEDFLDAAQANGLKICFVHGKADPGFDRTSDGLAQLEKREIPAKLLEYDGGPDLPDDVTTLVVEALRWIQNQ